VMCRICRTHHSVHKMKFQKSNRFSKLSAKLNRLSGVDWDKKVERVDRLSLIPVFLYFCIPVFPPRKLELTLRLLMSYIYGAPNLDVSRSHTTTQHSR